MNIKKRLATLMGMIATGNEEFKSTLDRLNGGEGALAPRMTRGSHVYKRKNAPGRKRKLGAQAYMKPRKPNPERRATKPFVGGWAHGTGMTGKCHSVPAPNLDQTAAMEQRLGLKVRVRGGECYVGDVDCPMPITATVEEATDILGEFIQKKLQAISKTPQLQFEDEYVST